ncbi:MAG: glycosyltransferase [Bacteroidales bacterium]|nr:glycosyltransferase [Bacteroidales bacterium]
MSGKGVLFVVRSFSRTGAQPIRFREILSFLSSSFDVHVLELTHGQGGVRHENGLTIHSLEYSLPGRMFNREGIPSGTMPGVRGKPGKLKSVVTRVVRTLLFPDSVITEGGRIRREALRLTREHKFDVVVLSAFPFTLMLSIRALRRKTEAGVILDVGDPFYKNSKNGFIRDKLAFAFEKRYLKSVDRLIVTNAITRDHYLRNYAFLEPEQVAVVSHGVSASFIRAVRGNERDQAISRDPSVFRLAYAGQLYMKMREPFELYKAISRLNTQYPPRAVRLDMYGSYNQEFLNCGPAAPYMSFKGLISHDDLIKTYLDYDAVVFIDNAYGMQTPGKIFEIALINRPVLCIADRNDSPALEELNGYGHIVVSVNRSEMIIDAIRKIMNTEFLFLHAEESERFAWESRSQQYKKIIGEVING